jgi:hypothetical protein
MLIPAMDVGCQLESQRIWTARFLRIAIVGAILLRQPSAFAQVPAIAVSDGTVRVTWPTSGYYYTLQSSTNLSGSHQWFNVATASPVSSRYSFALPGQSNPGATGAIADNVGANSYGITGTMTNDQQFFRLKCSIPLFGFAVFYEGMMEFTQTADMSVRGPVHANGPVCVGTTSSSLTFNGTVTTASTVAGPTRDGITPNPWNQGTTFSQGYLTNLLAFVSPFGTNNPHVLIDLPPANEDLTSALGQSRLYNQAHVMILVTNWTGFGTNRPTQITIVLQNSVNGLPPVRDPAKLSFTFIVTNSVPASMSVMYTNAPYGIGTFLTITNTFTDKREYQTNMFVTQIDIGAYAAWLETNGYVVGDVGAGITGKFGSSSPATILYVADWRGVGEANKLAVVRLINGARLPNNGGRGFSVATRNPLYVKGDYNVTADGIHFAYFPDSTTNIGSCVPAALMCDAITILSANFNDKTSGSTTVGAVDQTLNAAIITGNVPSTGTTTTTFSGGVHNLMRLLEDWNGDSLTLNTSIVVLYASQMATNQFRNPIGWTSPGPPPVNPYYKPPMRQWSFDPNFYDPAKLPPGTPAYALP